MAMTDLSAGDAAIAFEFGRKDIIVSLFDKTSCSAEHVMII